MVSPLVSVTWLKQHSKDSDVLLIDVSVDNVIGKEPILYDGPVTIPGSVKVSIEQELSDTEAEGVHVFPNAQQIAALASRLAICAATKIVVFDNQGIYSAPRAWWIFKSFGFDSVVILDGGLPEWMAHGFPTTDQFCDVSEKQGLQDAHSTIELNLASSAVKSADSILSHLNKLDRALSNHQIVVDVRAKARFYGQVDEPREGLRKGHIPNAVNLPFMSVLEANGYCTREALIELFADVLPNDVLSDNAYTDKECSSHPESYQATNLVFSCGSGMTACIVLVAAIIAGYQAVSLYDGSWAEWGANSELPIETE